MNSRHLLLKLHRAGSITLPAAKATPPNLRKAPRVIKLLTHDETEITGSLEEHQPLVVDMVDTKESLLEFQSLVAQYHYLSFKRTVGENMKYIIRNRDGKTLACLLFGSAAWKSKGRDTYIGWDKESRVKGLKLMTNNSRFLIVPWVTIPHLASNILGIITKRLSKDWEHYYGHPVFLLETFVDTERYEGSCYKAGNWIKVGSTAGRGRNDLEHLNSASVKDIYLYPLVYNFKDAIKEYLDNKE